MDRHVAMLLAMTTLDGKASIMSRFTCVDE